MRIEENIIKSLQMTPGAEEVLCKSESFPLLPVRTRWVNPLNRGDFPGQGTNLEPWRRASQGRRHGEEPGGNSWEARESAGRKVILLQRTRVNLPPENSWQCLQTFLVVTAGPGGAIASLGRGQGWSQHPTMHRTASHSGESSRSKGR